MLVRTPQLMTSNLHLNRFEPGYLLCLWRNCSLGDRAVVGEQAVFSRLAGGVDWRFLSNVCLEADGQHWG